MSLKDVFGDGYKQVMTGFILMAVGAALTIMPLYVGEMPDAVSVIGLVILLGSVMIMLLGIQIEGTGAGGADESFDVMSAITDMRDQLHEKIDALAGTVGLSSDDAAAADDAGGDDDDGE